MTNNDYTIKRPLAYIYAIGLLILLLIAAGVITTTLIARANDPRLPAALIDCNNLSYNLGGDTPERTLTKEDYREYCE